MRQTFERLLFHSYLKLIIITTLVISFASCSLISYNLYNNEKKLMNESLLQIQYNINTLIQFTNDYLSVTQSDSSLINNIKELPNSQDRSLLTTVNNSLQSVDLFKNTIDSLHIFLPTENNMIPDFSYLTKYYNNVFSMDSVADTKWYKSVKLKSGNTNWFIDYSSFENPVLSAARFLIDLKNPNKILGIIKINIPLDKIERQLTSVSFGNKGEVYFLQKGNNNHTAFCFPETSIDTLDQKLSSPLYLVTELPVFDNEFAVAGIIYKTELFKYALQNLLLILIIVCFSILFVTLLSKRMSKKVSLPLHYLSQKMYDLKNIKDTDFETANCIEIYQLFTSYQNMLKKNELLHNAREEMLLKYKQAEMAALYSQINPHFIYNTLESIQALIAIQDNTNAEKMTQELGKFLRNTLNKGNNLIPLSKEIEQVLAYIQIQKLRYKNRIDFQLNLPDPLPDYVITKLILQPLVENSLMHGFKDYEDLGIITISVFDSENVLILQVSDNGWGSDIEMLNRLVKQKTLYKEDNVNFYCISNIFQRLQNSYGENSSLTYSENKSGGVTATISIPKDML